MDEVPASGPYYQLYEQWSMSRGEDAAVMEQLAATYRDAWRANIGSDRYAVLYFIGRTKAQAGADLILEGLSSEQPEVAHAGAIWACVRDRDLDFGPTLRRAWRAHVRRFPQDDAFRPTRLYGHIDGDEDDTDRRPFVNLYEDWRAAEYPGHAELLQRLVDTYRESWRAGDAVERSFVLDFVLTMMTGKKHTQVVDAMDLVIEGLHTEDLRLGATASFVAGYLLNHGAPLTLELRSAIHAYCDRFGHEHSTSRNVTYELKKRDGLIPPLADQDELEPGA